MNPDMRELADLDRVIHEPARLTIVALLYAVKEADFLYLQRESGLTKGNLSSHLAKLEESGYLRMEKTYKGKLPLTLLSLTPKGRTAFARYRETLQRALTANSR